jgi:isoleucyl-tRNA synthetase
MSKSLGNVISPLDVCERRGAEILRLWVSMIDFLEDMRLSDEILDRNAEAYRKIRNTFRFLLGTLRRRPGTRWQKGASRSTDGARRARRARRHDPPDTRPTVHRVFHALGDSAPSR